MAKYDALREHLRTRSDPAVRLSLGEVAGLVPGGLPASAYKHPAWWSNDGHASHVQARAWLDAGWMASPDLQARTVTFLRST